MTQPVIPQAMVLHLENCLLMIELNVKSLRNAISICKSLSAPGRGSKVVHQELVEDAATCNDADEQELGDGLKEMTARTLAEMRKESDVGLEYLDGGELDP